MAYTILIVDDNKSFRSEFRDILEEEYDVLEAADGQEAIDIIKKPNMIDLAILDFKMPGIQGTEVLKQLKELEPGLIIIILTGYSSKELIIESLQKHADDFLEKPLNIEKTLNRIKHLLDTKQNDVKGVIEKLKYFVEKNFHKDAGLTEASEVVCLSPKYISKIFKEETGIGFNEYKLTLKMDKARELLSSHEYNINEIAGKTGYLNVESFVRIFKKMTGVTPSEYREKILKK
ncbi:MAG: response regulator transcription factor [Spirochaetales bacterium]|nr:response regulator transcription factor [Spirochaetales bacterium]